VTTPATSEFTHPYEMAGPNLKYKYRVPKTRSGYGSKSGNSGTPLRGHTPEGDAPPVTAGRRGYK